MSATTASERAQELVREISSTAMSVVAPGGSTASLGHADAKAALLAYVAALEACVTAARNVDSAYSEIESYDPQNVDDAMVDLRLAMAALDAPATEE